jgi:hypothetical protein
VRRVEEIMRKECPQARDYDAQVETRFHAEREAEKREKRKTDRQRKAKRYPTEPLFSFFYFLIK